MYDIQISDSLYELASEAAKEEHITIEEFVARAVERSLPDDHLELTPDQIAKVNEALEDVRAGRTLTLEQVKADFESHRAAWIASHPQ